MGCHSRPAMTTLPSIDTSFFPTQMSRSFVTIPSKTLLQYSPLSTLPPVSSCRTYLKLFHFFSFFPFSSYPNDSKPLHFSFTMSFSPPTNPLVLRRSFNRATPSKSSSTLCRRSDPLHCRFRLIHPLGVPLNLNCLPTHLFLFLLLGFHPNDPLSSEKHSAPSRTYLPVTNYPGSS